MPIKKYRPTSPGRRFMSVSAFDEVTTTKKPEKRLLVSLKTDAGRNAQGKLTVRHQGGGHRKLYRIIDFKRNKLNIPATVSAVEYDPNRSARIALLTYADGEKRYILAPVGLTVGDKVISGPEADIKPGNALPLASIPLGSTVHNIELNPGKGGQVVRSAGMSAQLLRADPDAIRRSAAGRRHLLCDDRPDRQRRARERERRQGRQEPLAWQAPRRPRRHHEPLRPSPRWWGGAFRPGRQPEDALGQAGARIPDPS